MTPTQRRVLVGLDELKGGPASHHAIAMKGFLRPAEAFDTLVQLEILGLVAGSRSAEVDRWGRPIVSTWALTELGRPKID